MKNVHDLLAKLAWDFSPEQLDHLFDCFKVSFQSDDDTVVNLKNVVIYCNIFSCQIIES